jgi:hypothetical protein
MTQAKGANARVSYVEETTWGTTPGSPSMRLLKAATPGVGLRPSYDRVSSQALNGLRSVEDARGGDVTVQGAVPFELALLGLGTLLKHAIGPVTTGEAVTQGSGLTGLTALQAETGTTAGAGTLSLSGDNATWAAQGDTAGAAVDVSEAGIYTLESDTDGNYLVVRSAGSPTGTSATVTVSSTQNTHIIRRGALPIGMTMELGYTDIDQYQVFRGCRVNSMDLQIPESGIVTGSLDIIGKTPVALSGTSLGTPTGSTHSPIMEHEASFQEGGAAGTALALAMSLQNNLEPVSGIGTREIIGLAEGKGDLTGSVTVLFEDETLVNKVINETASSLRLTFTVTGGSLDILLPRVKYFGPAGAGIETDRGLVVPMEWQALEDSAESSDIVVSITNTEASL